jgi:hypothetical protein
MARRKHLRVVKSDAERLLDNIVEAMSRPPTEEELAQHQVKLAEMRKVRDNWRPADWADLWEFVGPPSEDERRDDHTAGERGAWTPEFRAEVEFHRYLNAHIESEITRLKSSGGLARPLLDPAIGVIARRSLMVVAARFPNVAATATDRRGNLLCPPGPNPSLP